MCMLVGYSLQKPDFRNNVRASMTQTIPSCALLFVNNFLCHFTQTLVIISTWGGQYIESA